MIEPTMIAGTARIINGSRNIFTLSKQMYKTVIVVAMNPQNMMNLSKGAVIAANKSSPKTLSNANSKKNDAIRFVSQHFRMKYAEEPKLTKVGMIIKKFSKTIVLAKLDSINS